MSAPHYGGWSDYEDSVVDVFLGDNTVTLGNEGLITGAEWVPDATLYVITAFHPGSIAEAGANEDAQARLHDLLAERRLSWWPAVGRSRDNTWQEPSVALTGVAESEALAIGRHFAQDAIFKWDRRQLTVLPCEARTK